MTTKIVFENVSIAEPFSSVGKESGKPYTIFILLDLARGEKIGLWATPESGTSLPSDAVVGVPCDVVCEVKVGGNIFSSQLRLVKPLVMQVRK